MKNKLKNIASLFRYLVLLSIAMILVFQSCSSSRRAKSKPAVVDTHEQDGYVKATVIKYIDGCEFMLQLEEGKKLEPINLSEEFKTENMKVWIKYQPYKGSSICMVGQMVTVTAIEKNTSVAE